MCVEFLILCILYEYLYVYDNYVWFFLMKCIFLKYLDDF